MVSLSLKDRFLQEWASKTCPAPESPAKRAFGKAVVLLSPDAEGRLNLADNVVELTDIAVDPLHRNQGHMSVTLRALTSLADKHGIDIVLDASPAKGCELSSYELKQIYKKQGFYNAGGSSMRRDARQMAL